MKLTVQNLSFTYDYRPILKDISFSLEQGDFLIVVGNNGTGKSTLIKCLLKINKPSINSVFYDETDVLEFKDWKKIGYVPQKFEEFNYEFPITVNELLNACKSKNSTEKRKLELLDDLGVLDLANENINNLSGGQLQRVFIVRALLNNPQIIILDEPTASIDKVSCDFFFETINTLNKKGITVILITHDFANTKANYSHVLELSSIKEYSFHTKEIYFALKQANQAVQSKESE